MPNFLLEKRAGGRVAGVDEAGRGPLAGPVVAAAVVFPTGGAATARRLARQFEKVSAEQRVVAFQALFRLSGRAEIGVGAASVAEIERLNILRAALLAMCRAVARLRLHPISRWSMAISHRHSTVQCVAWSVADCRDRPARAQAGDGAGAWPATPRPSARLPAPPDLALVDGNQPPTTQRTARWVRWLIAIDQREIGRSRQARE